MADKGLEQRVASWIQKHFRNILFGIGFICVSGLSAFAWFQWEEYREQKAYNRIYIHQSAFEKAYKKANGDNHKRGARSVVDFFKPKKEVPFVYSNEMKTKAGQYEDAIRSNQSALAGAAAAIDLADFYYQAGEKEKALALLSLFSHRQQKFLLSLFGKNRSSSVYTLLRLQLAGFYMDKKNCEKALPLLSMITETKSAQPFHPEAWLQKGLCYEEMKDVFRVEEAYGTIKANYPDSPVAQTAEVYLRLFKISQKYNK
ncbi:MAG: hypothetical protein OXB86_07385 [Bdellovibrionales bacterium]|nr:hypothetical protein [Bdellovibrionales bacterium]